MVALEPIPADTGHTVDMLLVCSSANTDPNNHLYSHSYLQPKQSHRRYRSKYNY